MPTEIYLEKVDLGGGILRFDLVGKNLPENLLGLAADLEFTGDLKNFTYQSWELQEAMSSTAAINPMVIVKPDWEKGKLILGLAQKVNQMEEVEDGRIISLFFKGTGEVDFKGFSRQVISIYDGTRVDLDSVEWKNIPILGNWLDEQTLARSVENLMTLDSVPRKEKQSEQASLKETVALEEENDFVEKTSVTEDLQATKLMTADQQNIPVISLGGQDFLFSWWFWLGLTIFSAIMAFLLIWLIGKIKLWRDNHSS